MCIGRGSSSNDSGSTSSSVKGLSSCSYRTSGSLRAIFAAYTDFSHALKRKANCIDSILAVPQ
jgi:hypothetical protein